MDKQEVAREVDGRCYWCDRRAQTYDGLIPLKDGTHLCSKCSRHGPDIFAPIVPITPTILLAEARRGGFDKSKIHDLFEVSLQHTMSMKAYIQVEDVTVALPTTYLTHMEVTVFTMINEREFFVGPVPAFVTEDGTILTHCENFC